MVFPGACGWKDNSWEFVTLCLLVWSQVLGEVGFWGHFSLERPLGALGPWQQMSWRGCEQSIWLGLPAAKAAKSHYRVAMPAASGQTLAGTQLEGRTETGREGLKISYMCPGISHLSNILLKHRHMLGNEILPWTVACIKISFTSLSLSLFALLPLSLSLESS